MNDLHLLSDIVCKGLWEAFHFGESREAGITALTVQRSTDVGSSVPGHSE